MGAPCSGERALIDVASIVNDVNRSASVSGVTIGPAATPGLAADLECCRSGSDEDTAPVEEASRKARSINSVDRAVAASVGGNEGYDGYAGAY